MIIKTLAPSADLSIESKYVKHLNKTYVSRPIIST